MKKLLWILIFPCLLFATQQTLNGNLSGLTIASTDTIITGGNSTIDASGSFVAFWQPAGQTYTLAKSGSGRVLTLSGTGIFYKDSTSGIKTTPDSIAHTGASGRATVSSGSGAYTGNGTSWYFGGTDTLNDFKGVVWKYYDIGSKLVAGGTGTHTISAFKLASGGTLTCNTVLSIVPATTTTPISLPASYTWNGSTGFQIRANASSITITVPAISYTGSGGSITISEANSARTNVVFNFTGDQGYATNLLSIGSTFAGSSISNNFGSANVTCGTFRFGNNQTTGTHVLHYGSGTWTISTAYDGSNRNGAGTSIDSLESCTIVSTGNFTHGSNHTVVPGSSTVKMVPTAAATVTSSNKPFNNFKIAGTATKFVTLGDSLTLLGDFVDTTGGFKTAGFNVNASGDVKNYTPDSMLWSTSRITLNKTNALWLRQRGASAPTGGLAGATIAALGGVDFNIDTTMLVYRLYSAANKKIQFTAGANRAFRCSTYTAADLDNDTIISRTGVSKAYLNLPVNTPLTGSFIKYIGAINKIYDTSTTGLNGGNDSNIVFKYASGVYALSPTSVAVTSASPASVKADGGYLDTLAGTGFYPPCSVSVAGGSYIAATFIDTTKISFTTPSGAVGAKSVAVKNGDFQTGSGSVLTYTPACNMPSITSQPSSTTVTAPAIATFSVTATGDAPLSYQWQRNDTTIAGATTASYTTPYTNKTAYNGSTYRVIVSNACGSDTSNAATLTVRVRLDNKWKTFQALRSGAFIAP